MAASLVQFVNLLADSGLLAPGDVQALVDALPAHQRPRDGQQLARLLVKQRKLTPYQVQQIEAGQGPSLTLGNYVVLEPLGQGGMGILLKAQHKRMKRLVALKILSPNVTKTPEGLVRFQREVEAAAKLEHPHIVTAYDADEAEGTHFLVMEYVDGTDLAALVKERGPLSVPQVVSCILQTARGLQYAHGRGVVHRDIKPSNLLLDQEGTVKILDMGLARMESAGADQDQLTGTGQIMGTVDYMAPEQAMDTRSADARADIYALGITLWYLLVGEPAYEGQSVLAKLLAHQEAPIPSLQAACPGASAELEAIFARMVAKHPEDRYQTMGEVIADLEHFPRGLGDTPASALGDDHRQALAAGNWEPAGGSPAAKGAVATRAKKASPVPAALERTGVFSASQVETDPDTQHRLKRRSIPAAGRPMRWRWSRKQVVGLASGGGVAVLLLAALVFYLQTGAGTIRVEISDPAIEVGIKGTHIVLKQADQGQDVTLAPGAHTLIVDRGDFQFETDQLILKRGELVTLRIELVGGEIQVRQGEKRLGQRKLPPPPLAVTPFDLPTAQKYQQAWADYLGQPVIRTNGIGMELVLIPPGEFLMGSQDTEVDRSDDEEPQHLVRITKPFYLGVYEVTQEQYARVMGNNPSGFKGAKLPVEQMSWEEAVEFCKKLSEREGQTYGLPTEAQWEYACRAGSTTAYGFGKDKTELDQYAWYANNAGNAVLDAVQLWEAGREPYKTRLRANGCRPHAVGTKMPNVWGLYDMHGNLWEWCQDWFDDRYYVWSSLEDPTGPRQGSQRVSRGGGWNGHSRHCRSAHRLSEPPAHRHDYLGFRVSLVPASE